jgi:hypothetical protein
MQTSPLGRQMDREGRVPPELSRSEIGRNARTSNPYLLVAGLLPHDRRTIRQQALSVASNEGRVTTMIFASSVIDQLRA